MRRVRSLMLVVVIGAGLGQVGAVAMAGALEAPTGPVILTVSGTIQNTNADDGANFDRAMLERIGTTVMTTVTPWTEGEVTFGGVLARDLLSAVGAEGSAVHAIALNDYSADIPFSDLVDGEVLLALTLDGEPMRVRDKGPIWIIYPAESPTELQNRDTRRKMVWQLKALRVK